MAKQKHNTYYNENTPDSGIYYYNENGEAKKVDVGSTYSAGEGIKIEEKIISVSADYAYNSAVSSLHNTTLTSTNESVEISSTTAADGTVNYDLSVEGHSDTEIVGENGISAEKVQNTSTWKVGVSADYATEEYVDDEIAKLGKPLTYSGSKTVEQINALTDVKVGTVYTIAGESGTIVSGNVECKQGDEVAWASTDEWFLIGNTISENNNSWKYMSELHNCEPEENSIYIGDSNVSDLTSISSDAKFGNVINIGSGNSARAGGVNIGDNNEIVAGDKTIANINIGKNNQSKFGVLIGQDNKTSSFNYVMGDMNSGFGVGSYLIGTEILGSGYGSLLLGNNIRNGGIGDIVLGYNIDTPQAWASRLVVGKNISGLIEADAVVIGNNISAKELHSSITLTNENTVSNRYGSIVIATPKPFGDQYSAVSISAESDGVVIGGYASKSTLNGFPVSGCGIAAKYNGVIIGQGLYASAENDGTIIGSNSIASAGGYVFGVQGYATSDSMVLNWNNNTMGTLQMVYIYDKDTGTTTTANVVPSEVIDFSTNPINNLLTTSAMYGSLAIGNNIFASGGGIGIVSNTDYSNYFDISGIKENGETTYVINHSGVNSACGGSILISTYKNGRNFASENSVVIGTTDNTGYNVGIVIGTSSRAGNGSYVFGRKAYANFDSVAINQGNYDYTTAESGSISIGTKACARNNSIVISNPMMADRLSDFTTAENGAIAIGQECFASQGSLAIGGHQSATNRSMAIGIKGAWNNASSMSMAIGFQNTAKNQSFVQGFNNYGVDFTYIFGFNNEASGMDTLVGFGNRDYFSKSNFTGTLSDMFDVFGRWNGIAGSLSQVGQNKPTVNYEVTIVGNNNSAYITNSDWYYTNPQNSWEFAGIFLGKSNSCYMSKPGGYNIYLGSGNKGAYEAINIGTNNESNGHSISLGWMNTAIKGGAGNHAIMLGYMNSAVNDRELLNSKSIKLQKLIHYSDELMQAAYNEYTAQSATLYQNSATTSFSCYDRWGDPVNASFYLIDYWYNNSEFGFDILFPVEAGFNSASWDSYNNSKYFYVSNSYSATLRTKYYNEEITYDFYSKIRYISNYTTLTSTKSQIINYWTQDRTQQYYIYTAASANYYEKVRTNNTYESATSSVRPATNSFIVGTNNSAAHYNSYLFGSHNQSLTYNNTSANDDGFVFAMGFNNIVSRNYDMAIGYGSVASGGENIAIGTPHYNYNNNEAPYAAAIGYKNIAFNAYVEGIMNIAYDSIITIPFSDWRYGNNKFHSVKSNTWTYTPNLNFHNNYLDFVNGGTIDVGKNFNCNVINQMSGTTLLTDEQFDFNELFMIDRSNISSYQTSRNTMKYFSVAKMYTHQLFGNILYNIGSGTDLSADAVTENIFFNEGGSSGNSYDPRNRIALTANKLGQNFIFNTSLMGSATEGAGINQNFLINSHISANHNYLQYGIDFGYDTIGHSFIYGTDISGQASETFSFAASYDSTGTSRKAVLSRVSKITNFGDNVIKNSYDSFVYGDTNTVTSVGNSFIEGRLNLVQGPRDGNAVSNGYCTLYNNVHGNVNVISNTTTAEASRLINSVIIGDGNSIIRDSSNVSNYVTHNTIMGYVNGIMSVPETVITNAQNAGMYNWVISNGDVYQNILRYTTNTFISSGGELLSIYGNRGSFNNARNNIIGSHSIISDNVNDSTLIGSFNVAYCNQLQTFNTMTANFEPWTSKSYAKSACVVYNGSAFSSTIANNTYTPTNASYWSKITYTEGSSYNTLSNNYVMGSFNLSENGSNQVILGNSNIASGHNSISIGEGLISDASQTVLGRYNAAIEGTNGISADYVDSKSGALLIVGNGRHINDRTDVDSIERSNAMIVSADGTVSATKFATPEVSDIGSSLNELQGIITLLQNKPTTGKHVIGVDNGVLSWIEINQ